MAKATGAGLAGSLRRCEVTSVDCATGTLVVLASRDGRQPGNTDNTQPPAESFTVHSFVQDGIMLATGIG